MNEEYSQRANFLSRLLRNENATDILSILASEPALLSFEDSFGHSFLFYALFEGRLDVVNALMESNIISVAVLLRKDIFGRTIGDVAKEMSEHDIASQIHTLTVTTDSPSESSVIFRYDWLHQFRDALPKLEAPKIWAGLGIRSLVMATLLGLCGSLLFFGLSTGAKPSNNVTFEAFAGSNALASEEREIMAAWIINSTLLDLRPTDLIAGVGLTLGQSMHDAPICITTFTDSNGRVFYLKIPKNNPPEFDVLPAMPQPWREEFNAKILPILMKLCYND